MLIDVRRTDFPTLDAYNVRLDARTPDLRVGIFATRNLVTDLALLNRSTPFVGLPRRDSALTLVVEGLGRYEEQGRCAYLSPGDYVVCDNAMRGTDSHAGTVSTRVTVEWTSGSVGRGFRGPFTIQKLDHVAVARIAAAARRIEGPDPAAAVVEVLAVFRAAGVGFDRVSAGDVGTVSPELQRVQTAISHALANVASLPSVDDVAREIGANARLVHRRIRALHDQLYTLAPHWRTAVHQVRMLQAIQLLGAPGATTEQVARLAGFRAATALCHAFADAGLPAPGRLAEDARSDALDRWLGYAVPAARLVLPMAVAL